jgi:hypothetical protein
MAFIWPGRPGEMVVSATANSFHRHSGSSSTSKTAGRVAITLSDCGSPRPVRKYLIRYA